MITDQRIYVFLGPSLALYESGVKVIINAASDNTQRKVKKHTLGSIRIDLQIRKTPISRNFRLFFTYTHRTRTQMGQNVNYFIMECALAAYGHIVRGKRIIVSFEKPVKDDVLRQFFKYSEEDLKKPDIDFFYYFQTCEEIVSLFMRNTEVVNNKKVITGKTELLNLSQTVRLFSRILEEQLYCSLYVEEGSDEIPVVPRPRKQK